MAAWDGEPEHIKLPQDQKTSGLFCFFLIEPWKENMKIVCS